MSRSHGGPAASHAEGGTATRAHDDAGSRRPRAHGGGTGSIVQLTAALKAKFTAGKPGGRGKSVILANADEWAARGGNAGPQPEVAVLYMHNRSDFHAGDFRRKVLDLVRLGDEGKLAKVDGTTERPGVPHRQPDKFPRDAGSRTMTRIFRERVITRLSKAGKKIPGTENSRRPRKVRDEANQRLLNKLFRGRDGVGRSGLALDPDHIHELQLMGEDAHSNLRLMDAWTNREMGREIHLALRSVPPGTRVIVRLVE